MSAISFLVAYVMLFTDPVAAALIGWLVAMVSRQSGHFFFEPKGYDEVNHATHEYKEDDQGRLQPAAQGDSARRLGAVAARAVAEADVLRHCSQPHDRRRGFMRHVGEIWLVVGIGALLFRTVQLFFLRDVQTGLVWLTKIITDPFNDVKLYCKAPLYLLRGELMDPMVTDHRA